MKPILLIIDGMDKSGKTTLINFINKKTDYAPLILDRGPIGYKVYSKLNVRDNTPKDYDKLEKTLLLSNHLCVYLYASHSELSKRFIESYEKNIKFGIQYHLDLFNNYYTQSKLNKISIDTTNLTVEETFKCIEKECKKYN